MLRGYLKKARLSLGGDNRLMIVLPDSLSASVVGREDHVAELEDLIEKKIEKKGVSRSTACRRGQTL